MDKASNKTHKTAIVVIPPSDLWPAIQMIRSQHDRHFHRWMPHITLIYPFRHRNEFGMLAGRLSQACAAIAPFELTLANFKFFHHRKQNYTIWLAPEPADALIGLQTALWQVVPDCDEVRRNEEGFTPHLSVGQVEGRESQTKLIKELQNSWQAVKFPVVEVSLIWRNDPPDDIFCIDRTIKLPT
ncbi:MAG: 2'-5' RNA ligase family protein [Acidobacteriota bacterium]